MDTAPQMAVKKTRANKQAYCFIDYSGLFERFFAWCADTLIIGASGYLLYKLLGLLAAVILSFIIDLLFRVVSTYFWGGTPGKLLLGVKVISRNAEKLRLGQVVIRELFKYISWVFVGLGFLTIIFNRRKRAWHDMMACTAVTSGGRDEAQYAKGIYSERPEKWHVAISSAVTGVLIIGMLISINIGARHILYDNGMFGFHLIAAFPSKELAYKMPEGAKGFEKALIQVGDVDGNGRYEIFREGIEDGKIFIRNVRLSGVVPVDGEKMVSLDKPILQYRVLDMDGDKRDEIAVLCEDKSVKIYKLENEAQEIATYSPMAYNSISSFIKGKPDESVPWRLYILGDGNKLTILYMENGKLKDREFDLESPEKLTSIGMGILGGKNYIVGSSKDSRLIFYSYDGVSYRFIKDMAVPIKGEVNISVEDMNYDDKNEVMIWSPSNGDRPYPVMAAYSISDDNMRLVWDGGRFYVHDGIEYQLSFNDALDIDRDGDLELYMVDNKVSGKDGKYAIFVFQNDDIILKLNDFMRLFSLSDVK